MSGDMQRRLAVAVRCDDNARLPPGMDSATQRDSKNDLRETTDTAANHSASDCDGFEYLGRQCRRVVPGYGEPGSNDAKCRKRATRWATVFWRCAELPSADDASIALLRCTPAQHPKSKSSECTVICRRISSLELGPDRGPVSYSDQSGKAKQRPGPY